MPTIIEIIDDDEQIETNTLSKEEQEKEKELFGEDDKKEPVKDNNGEQVEVSDVKDGCDTTNTEGENILEEVKGDTNKESTQNTGKKELSEEELSKYPRMTEKAIKEICVKHKLYRTPYLNDVLYLHYKGYVKIENLELYTGLKCLYLECNGFRKIENFTEQKELKCLYLQQNLIEKIENLEPLQVLDTLNLSNNMIERIENLSCLTKLSNITMAHNRLKTAEDIQHLTECKNISVVDVSHNKLDDPAIIDVFAAMPILRVLNLMGNPVIKKIKNYRKTLIIKIKSLVYLDDRPVFDKDRALAEAWARGGREEEKAERQRWIDADKAKMQASFDAMLAIRNRADAARKEREEVAKQCQEKNEKKKLPFKHEHYPSEDEDLNDGDESVTESRKQDDNTAEDKEDESNDIFDEEQEEDDFVDKIASECIATGKSDKESRLTTHMAEDDNIDTVFLTEGKINIDDLPDLEDVDVSEEYGIDVDEPKRTVYKPMIEVLEDDDIEDETDNKPLIEEVTSKPASQKSLIEEVSIQDTQKLLFEEVSRPNDVQTEKTKLLIEDIEQSTSTKLVIEDLDLDKSESTKLVIEDIDNSDSHTPLVSETTGVEEDKKSADDGAGQLTGSLPKHIQDKIQELAENAGSTSDRPSLDAEVQAKLRQHRQKGLQQ
ncbi:uncharacterized protein LOC144434014 isoform X2 [Glandiceps talaboti]